MSEDGGRNDHLRVVAALENFQVGAAGERGLDAEADFAGLERGRREVFDLDLFFSVQDGGFHPRRLRPLAPELKPGIFIPAAGVTRLSS